MSKRGDSRRVDWSAVKGNALSVCVTQIVAFAKGIRGERANGVSKKQILRWFSGTPADFIERAIWEAIANGKLDCFPKSRTSGRRHNGAYVYIATKTGDVQASSDTVVVKKADLYSMLGLLREEQGTTGFLLRQSIARLLGRVRPTEEEVRAHIIRQMEERGVRVPPEAEWDDDIRDKYNYLRRDFNDFLADPEIWESEEETEARRRKHAR